MELQIRAVKAGYEIRRLEVERSRLEEQNGRLGFEMSRETIPSRLKEKAERLQLGLSENLRVVVFAEGDREPEGTDDRRQRRDVTDDQARYMDDDVSAGRVAGSVHGAGGAGG